MDKSEKNKMERNKLSEENEYLNSLTKQEKKTLEIARSHLESSFNMDKSIGFIQWKENQMSLKKSN